MNLKNGAGSIEEDRQDERILKVESLNEVKVNLNGNSVLLLLLLLMVTLDRK